jgi:chaperonin GroEL
MAKILTFKDDARNKLKSGVDQLADAVSSTLGPAGRTVVIEKEHEHVSTKDGVTVAKEIDLKDAIENSGAQMVKEVANQVNDEAGDGTTTATVLARAILTEGLKILTTGGNAVEIKRGINIATKEVVKGLDELSTEVSSAEEIQQVAKISANGDTEVGNLISEAMDKVGREGVVTVEESNTADDELELVEGMQFERGYLSPYFITNQQEMKVQLENPWILLYDKKISSLKEIVKILEQSIAANRPLLIIAEDVEGEALAGLIVNKARGTLQVAAIKAPEFGDRRTQCLEDIAALTGGTLISPSKGLKLDKFNTDDFGSAKLVTITNKYTTIIDGEGSSDAIEAKCEEIKTLIDNSTSDYDIEKAQERLAKLSGGVAIMKVGAETELELKEKKDRVEDALNATRAALDEGVVPGGGIALLTAINNITKPKLQKDQSHGWDILIEACKSPFNTIMSNAGLNADVIWNEVNNSDLSSAGYDARSEEVVDMIQSGIIDPTKVTKTALQKAASVAGTMLTTECVITTDKEDKDDSAPDYPMM